MVGNITGRKGHAKMDSVDGSKVVVRINTQDISTGTAFFKSHREYIEHRFKQLGYKITLWNWDRRENGQWSKDERGISFKKTDSNIDMIFEVIGTIGKNIRRLGGKEDGDNPQGEGPKGAA